MLAETLLGTALAAGVIGIILVVKALTSRNGSGTPGVEAVTALCCAGEAGGLELAVREACSRRGSVYIVDLGLSREAARRARLLAARYGATYTDGGAFARELAEKRP